MYHITCICVSLGNFLGFFFVVLSPMAVMFYTGLSAPGKCLNKVIISLISAMLLILNYCIIRVYSTCLIFPVNFVSVIVYWCI